MTAEVRVDPVYQECQQRAQVSRSQGRTGRWSPALTQEMLAGKIEFIHVCPNATWTWYMKRTGVCEPWIEKMKEQMNGTYFLVHTYSELHSFIKAIF